MKVQEWEVEAILDWRVVTGGTEYLIKWKDYPPEESTWEPEACLKHSQKLLKEFKKGQEEKEEEAKKGRVSAVARTPKNIKKEPGVERKSRKRPNQGVDDVVQRPAARRVKIEPKDPDEEETAGASIKMEQNEGRGKYDRRRMIVKVTEENKDFFLWKVPPVAADERGAREEKVLLKQLDFEGAEVVGHLLHDGQRFYVTKFKDGAQIFVHSTIVRDKARDAAFDYLEGIVFGREPINVNVA